MKKNNKRGDEDGATTGSGDSPMPGAEAEWCKNARRKAQNVPTMGVEWTIVMNPIGGGETLRWTPSPTAAISTKVSKFSNNKFLGSYLFVRGFNFDKAPPAFCAVRCLARQWWF